jgi:hypothetical protein
VAGYDNPAKFSREYKRHFGFAPRRLGRWKYKISLIFNRRMPPEYGAVLINGEFNEVFFQ